MSTTKEEDKADVSWEKYEFVQTDSIENDLKEDEDTLNNIFEEKKTSEENISAEIEDERDKAIDKLTQCKYWNRWFCNKGDKCVGLIQD